MPIVQNKLRQAREEADLTQREIAKMLGLNQTGYSDFETGKTQPSINYLMELSAILKKPFSWFLDIEDGGELTPDEVELLEVYRKLPASQKPLIIMTINSWLDL